ncbi:hypothetical protein QQF45_17620 [Halopseudomonas aestusnigri]|uniref:hypothetical protein n=1 Tax=Halopseudomonas aestusnigri TaxID=857252 RepID=UPI0025532AFD|nr:hypothetical protein [Halopseudomonas aestusnigri]MDL2200863.1 hypothetical protein [Halopseudomonas aestusnigri]
MSKPEVVAWRALHCSGDWTLREAPTLPSTGLYTGEIEGLIRLTDYEAARAQYESRIGILERELEETQDISQQEEYRANGYSGELVMAKARIEELEAALGDLLAIVSDSTGVAGYHLNGAVAEWGDFDVVSAASAALSQQGKEGET